MFVEVSVLPPVEDPDWPVPVLGASVVLPFVESPPDVPVSLPASELPAPLPAVESSEPVAPFEVDPSVPDCPLPAAPPLVAS